MMINKPELASDTTPLSEDELIERIGLDSGWNYELNSEGAPTSIYSDEGDIYIRRCRRIEKIIREIALSTDPVRVEIATIRGVYRTQLTKIGEQLQIAFMELSKLDEIYEHSPYIELFASCLEELGINRREGESITLTQLAKSRYLDHYKIFDELVALVRDRSKQKKFRRKLTLASEKVKRRMSAAAICLNEIFQKRSKVLVVRVDLSYKKDPDLDLQLARIKKDLNRLLNNRRGNKSIFSDLLGYIWKIESGISRGLHLHCIFIFDGHKRRGDIYYGHEIGRYWVNVIVRDGIGCFFNCNANKRKYDQVGIGMVLRNDIEKRSILLNRVVNYLAKSDTVISAKVLNGQKCFSANVYQ